MSLAVHDFILQLRNAANELSLRTGVCKIWLPDVVVAEAHQNDE